MQREACEWRIGGVLPWQLNGVSIDQGSGLRARTFLPRFTAYLVWVQLMHLQIKCIRGTLGLANSFVEELQILNFIVKILLSIATMHVCIWHDSGEVGLHACFT